MENLDLGPRLQLQIRTWRHSKDMSSRDGLLEQELNRKEGEGKRAGSLSPRAIEAERLGALRFLFFLQGRR